MSKSDFLATTMQLVRSTTALLIPATKQEVIKSLVHRCNLFLRVSLFV